MDRKHRDKRSRVPHPTQQTEGRCCANGNQYDHGYPADSGGETGCPGGYQLQVWTLVRKEAYSIHSWFEK